MGDTACEAQEVKVECAYKLLPILTKPKRLKISIGGRGASKSIAYADSSLYSCDQGEKILCAREFQNSIEDSVHGLLKGRIKELGVEHLFDVSATGITSHTGGEIFYKGLSRNVDSIKSTYGIDKVWIEEGSTISQKTVDVLLPTIREEGSEIWISMNRGSSKDPIYKSLVAPHEKHIAVNGYYEDDDILIVEINYYDNPWFPEVLEQQRKRDYQILSRAKYNHIWLGHLSDTIDNAIIEPEWFDACIDSHITLGFEAQGIEVVTHDPADSGDNKALAYRHGSVIKEALQREDMNVNTACDWACGFANEVKTDVFVWDGDGLGVSLRRDIANHFDGKHTALQMFNGGSKPQYPKTIYEPLDGEVSKAKSNAETFYNARAQAYWMLRDRMLKTYLAVNENKYFDPDELVSISSEIEDVTSLRTEVCRIPKIPNGNGKIQLMSKKNMMSEGIQSPNMADCLAMLWPIDMINSKKKSNTKAEISVPQAFSHFG